MLLTRSLSRQIAVRLGLALLITAVTVALVTLVFQHEANRRELRQHADQASAHVAANAARREIEWEQQAYNLRTRIEYAAVLDDPGQRQRRFANFLTAQSGTPEFAVAVVYDKAGERIASHDFGRSSMPPPVFGSGDAGWAEDVKNETLFRVYRQKIWLGNGQSGVLQLYRALDNALLDTLSYPETDVFLLWHERPIASSLGDAGLAVATSLLRQPEATNLRRIDWSPTAVGNPQVLIRIVPAGLFRAGELAQPILLGFLVFIAVAWVIFGAWATGTVRRIVALGQVHDDFADERRLSPTVVAGLDKVRQQRHDELAAVADSLFALMTVIQRHETEQMQTTELLKKSEERFRILVEGTQAVAWEFDRAGNRYTYVSPQATRLLGHAERELLAVAFLDRHLHPADLADILTARQTAFAAGRDYRLEYRLRRDDGSYLWLRDMASAAGPDPAAAPIRRGIMIDISESKSVEERLHLAGMVFESASEGIMVTDSQNRIVSVNPAFEAITGYRADEVLGADPKLLQSGLQSADFYARMWSELATRGRWSGEVWNRRKSGEFYAQRLSITTTSSLAGSAHRYLALFSDVTEQKRQAEEIERQAGHDALTNLPNRRLLTDRMHQAIARAQRSAGRLGFIMIDLDGFKHINDTLGHRVGDLLLVETARRLQRCVRDSDTVARIGGDEFMLVLPDIDDQDDLRTIAGKILENVRAPYRIEGKNLFVSGSIGITVYPDDGADAEMLLAHADTAMYRAKGDGKNTFRFFTAEMHAHAMSRLQIENDLRRALLNHEFVLHFQPVYELAGGRLVKCEALIRWQHPERGLVMPKDFIPIAEDAGLIVAVGNWVIDAALLQVAAWRSRAPANFRVSINLSAQQFQRGDCVAQLQQAMQRKGAGAEQLIVEITESLFIDDRGDAQRQLTEMKSLDIKIAIDDFGTGYSSLSYLKRFPVDTLKIDRAFVSGIPDDPEDMALIEAIIAMSRALGLEVIAEGIETEAQHEFLRARGCQYGQGYLFGRPMPAAAFEALFASAAGAAPRLAGKPQL